MMWSDYWVWFAGALILGILEIIAPGYILLGFALSAGVIGTILAIGGAPAMWLAGSLPITLVVFAAVALALWLILRKVFALKTGQVKTFDHDINDN